MEGNGRPVTEVKRVALVMIHGMVARCNVALRRKDRVANKAAGDGATLPGKLIGIGQVSLATMRETRRAQSKLPALDKGAIDGDGQIGARLSDVGVIQKIIDSGLEGVGIQQPACQPSSDRTGERNLDAELVLLIVLAMKGLIGRVLSVGIGHERP